MKAIGDWKVAWPPEVENPIDLPWPFVEAWQTALTVLGWFENLSEDDQPPKDIWHDSRRLEAHFAEIRSKWRGKSSDAGTEAPEGSLADAEAGMNVTLRNKLVEYVKVAVDPGDDDFTTI